MYEYPIIDPEHDITSSDDELEEILLFSEIKLDRSKLPYPSPSEK